MLAASAAILALLGFGVSFVAGNDEEELLLDSSDEEQGGEDETAAISETVGVEEFIFAEPTDVEVPATSMDPTQQEDIPSSNGNPLQDDQEMEQPVQGLDGQSDAPTAANQDIDHSGRNLLAGGPGAVLVGGASLDNFEVTVGKEGDPETRLLNLFEVTENSSENETNTGNQIETIWLKDSQGEIIPRETLLSSDLSLQDDEARNGVTLSLNGHSTLFIDDVSLDDFIENSLVLGNFQLR